MARYNSQPDQHRQWKGLRDGQVITLDLADTFLPLSDLDSGSKWLMNFACPECGTLVTDIGAYASGHRLACGHSVQRDVNGALSPTMPEPTAAIYRRVPQPESLDTTAVPPIGFNPKCPHLGCNKLALEIGSIQKAGEMTILKLKCGHKARRWPDSTLEEVK